MHQLFDNQETMAHQVGHGAGSDDGLPTRLKASVSWSENLCNHLVQFLDPAMTIFLDPAISIACFLTHTLWNGRIG
jgi:hypothetical protein